jgi:glyoxylase-like metal-dependent hydrolase (beta-lactamase superfamily II)
MLKTINILMLSSMLVAGAVHAKNLDDYTADKVADNIYVVHGPLEMPTPENKGFMNNPAFIVAEKGVVVIDPGSTVNVGKMLVKHIREVTDKPIIAVFNSHIHGDHWLGNQAIVEENPDVKIYAHPRLVKMAKAGLADQWIDLMMQLTNKASDGTKAVLPTEELEDGQVVDFGDVSIKSYLTEHSHTKTDAMFEVVGAKVVFMGDNAPRDRIIRLDDASYRGSIEALDRMLEASPEVVIPGHGNTGDKQILEAYKQYLSVVYTTAKELMDEGMEPFEMKAVIAEKLPEFKDWSGFDDELGKHVSLAVLEAEQADFE